MRNPSFKDEVVSEYKKAGDVTVYCCYPPPLAKYIPDVFVEDNETKDVQLLHSGFNCGISAVSEDARWIIICDAARMGGGIWIFERQKGAAYQEVEKDLTQRAIAFEKANGLAPPAGAEVETELFGSACEMLDSHRILLNDISRLSDNSSFQTGVQYDFETRTFAVPTVEEKIRLQQPNFGGSSARVIGPEASPTPQAAQIPGREYVQRDCYALRYYSDLSLFLSVQNDSDALAKLEQTGRLKLLIETQEVDVVAQDVSGLKQIREPGEIETYYVLANQLSSTRPQGPIAEISAREWSLLKPLDVLISYIQKMEEAKGPATLRLVVDEMHQSRRPRLRSAERDRSGYRIKYEGRRTDV
jgi:hypothetical protein